MLQRYPIMLIEAILMTVLAMGRTSPLTIRGTHLVERMGLLSLIIMGEGIIGMTKCVTKIMQGSAEIDFPTVIIVACSVLVIVRSISILSLIYPSLLPI